MPQYQGVWNLAQQAQALTRQQWVTDPLFDYTTLLLQADNVANGAQNNTFLDSSTANGGLGFPITRNGNTTQGSFSPFAQGPGYWGVYFDGTGDYLTAGTSISLSGSFTIEGWVYITSIATNTVLFGLGDDNTSTGLSLFVTPTGQPRMLANNAYPVSGSTGQVPPNTWVHLALVRSGTSLTLYVNGLSVGTGTSSLSFSGTAYVGAENYASTIFITAAGYSSNVRVGTTAVYTAAFTPSPTPLTAITGTALLTCQSNRFVDNSSNAYALTRNGDVAVQPFSPFAPQYQYTPTVTGGSGYFDGSGDFLSSTSTLTFSTNPFTVEFWIYPTVAATQMMFACATANNNALQVQCTASSGNLNVAIGTWGVGATLTSTGAPIKLNQWNHVVAVRSATSTNGAAIFVNGSRNVQGTVSTNYGSGSIVVGGITGGTQSITGYMSGLVVTNGTANYSPASTTITVPSVPPSPTGSTLCLNFTNAGILDGTMKNNLETVGNAQVSTNAVKYGSGSMFFDGSGDYLLCADRSSFDFGTGDFTLECWVYLAATPSTTNMIIDTRAADTVTAWSFSISGTSKLDMIYGAARVTSTGSVPTGAWTHVAATRTGGTIRLFINGVQDGSVAFSSAINSANTPAIGGGRSTAGATVTGYYYNGYMDDLRITKGIARYTRNFTPPQVALPRQ